MTDRFYSISEKEMDEFMIEMGFQSMQVPNTRMLVYGKIVKIAETPISIRVYTGIDPDEGSRAKGTEAIEIRPYCRLKCADYPVIVGMPQKCHRVKNWQKNMTEAIERCTSPENFRFCSACGSMMTVRKRGSDNQKFWGCSTWKWTGCNGRPQHVEGTKEESPKTRKSLPKQDNQRDPMAKFRIPSHLISEQQHQAEMIFVQSEDNIMIGARAGAGKTTLLKHLGSFCDASKKIIYLSFNKKNAVEGQEKLPRFVESSTTHRFCGQWLRQHYEMPKQQDGRKNFRIMEEVYPMLDRNNKARRRVRSASFRLLNLAKCFACRPDDKDSIKDVMEKYDFDLEGDGEALTVVENVQEALQMSLPQPDGGEFGMSYNFDDMLWWPIVMDLEPPKVDILLADEVQDFNACQIEMVRRIEAAGGRVVAVGDPFQAVYRFRGADNQAYSKLEETLNTGKRSCQGVILPTNYRCGKAHIQYVQEHTIVKDIQAAPTALEGEILNVDYGGLIDLIVDDLLEV